MAKTLDPADEKPITLRASADASELGTTNSLTILGERPPKVGDDIEVSFPGGVIAYAAIVSLNGYNFPVIEFRGERFVLLPPGRTGDIGSEAASGTRWLVTKP